MKGVTIKDALEAIHKQFKKRVCLYPTVIPAHVNLVLACPLYPALTHTCAISRHVSSIANSQRQQDDEFEKPYLAGFEWDPEEDYTRFVVHQTNAPTSFGKDQSSKKKKKAAAAEE